MSTSKAQRVLVVVSHLASGDTDYLYRFIDAAGQATAETVLGDDYVRIVKRYGSNATLPKLISALRTEGGKSAVKKIDVILMVHGLPGELAFKDATYTSSDVRAQIRALNLTSKLRLLYSTACYGDSHSTDFIAAGFDTAIGSKKVNANAAVEFAPLLGMWQFNNKISDALGVTTAATPAADSAATAYGRANNTSWKNDVKSTKVIRGNKDLRIST